MPALKIGEDIFESGCDLIDVTSLHRPDPTWVFVDAQGHEHRWWRNGEVARVYKPTGKYTVPSLKWILDDIGYFEDGESYEIGHHECRQCGEHVEPRSCPDTFTQYIPGLRWYTINGQSVSHEEFKRRLPKGTL